MGDPSVLVAIVDDGVQLDHPDLLITNSWDSNSSSSPGMLYYAPNSIEPDSHGMSMVGIIGARTNNSVGIVGIAPNVSLLPISVNFNIANRIYLGRAVMYAADNGADIISNSWSSDQPHTTRDEAFEYALDKGCIILQSMGNYSSSTPRYPYKLYPQVITVGNIMSNGQRRSTSNYGEHLDVVAPGTSIRTLNSIGDYTYSTGTSPACPHVAATAALMLSVNPDLTSQEICNIIERTARKLPNYTFYTTSGRPNGTWNDEVGYGLVNCYDAVSQAYYSNYDNYTELIEFDYTGQEISLKVTTTDDIAVIWDWDAKEISYIHGVPDSPAERTLTHTYTSSGTRHVSIAECIAPGESAQTRSSALREFKFITAESAKNISIKYINDSLRTVEIIGGEKFESQILRLTSLKGLERLFLRHLPGAQVQIGLCPNLRYLSTSPTIWIPNNVIYPGTVMPNVVIGDQPIPRSWPDIPEPIKSIESLNLSLCPKLEQISLENVNLINMNLNALGSLQYVYLSSQSDRIVGASKSGSLGRAKGGYLVDAVKSLPTRVKGNECAIVVRGVNFDATEYEAVEISRLNHTSLMSNASNNHWNVYWESGYVLQ